MKCCKRMALALLTLLLCSSFTFASIAGKVQSVDSKPIVNAKVICRVYEGEDKERRFVTRTDSRGQFVFHEAKITPEGYGASLYAVADGYGVNGCRIRSNNPKVQFGPETLPPDKTVTITLFPETVLEFRVVDESGQPVHGVKVTVVTVIAPLLPNIREFFEATLPTWLSTESEAKELGLIAVSDEDGFVRLKNLPRGGAVHLWLEHERFGRIVKPAATSDPEIRLSQSSLTVLKDIVLEEPGEAEGEVQYEDGSPASGIRLFWRNPLGWISGEVTTNEQGRYRLSKLQPCHYEIWLHYEEPKAKEWVAMPPVVNFSVRSGQKVTLPTITLTKGGFLEGVATDVETGKPVADVVIAVGQIVKQADAPVLQWVAQAKTDKQGRYRVQVPPGEFECYIGAPPIYLPPVEFLPTAPNPYKGVIKKGETTRMNIQLRKGLVVRGRVVDETGKPVPNAVVLNMETEIEPQRVVTDEQGNFVLTNLQPLKQVRLRAYKNDLRTKEDIVLFPDEAKAKDIVLKLAKIPLPKVKGRVVDEAGKPIPNAIVTANWIREFVTETFARASSMGREMAVTDGKGQFEVVGLWQGDTYGLSIKAEGYGAAWTEKFTLKIGEIKDVGTITLKRAGCVVTGTVIGYEGPLQNVSVYEPISIMIATRTDKNGKFELRGLTAGRHKLVVREPTRYGWLNLEIEIGEGKDSLKILSVRPAMANIESVEVRNGELFIFLRPVTPKVETEKPKAELELRPPEVGKPAPDLSVQVWLNTKPLTLLALRGKIVVLDFCDWFG